MDIAALRKVFSSRIRKLREDKKLNQGEFADSVGVSRGAMSYYEQEARTPDIGVLRAICERYNVSADYLLGLIPDENHTVSDVCRETGLFPKAARRLLLLQKLKETRLQSAATIVEKFDEEVNEILQLTPYTTATAMVNLLLSTDEGLRMFNILSAILMDAKLQTGSDSKPYFELITNHKDIKLKYPLQNLTAALWVNYQQEADKLKEKVREVNPWYEGKNE